MEQVFVPGVKDAKISPCRMMEPCFKTGGEAAKPACRIISWNKGRRPF